MNVRSTIWIFLFSILCWAGACSQSKQKADNIETTVVNVADYGLKGGTKKNASPVLKKIITEHSGAKKLEILFPKGEYHFYRDSAYSGQWFISNHSENARRYMGIPVHNMRNVTIDGNGSEFSFHGKMTSVLIEESSNITLKNFSIDWPYPILGQAEVIETGNGFVDIRIPDYCPYFIENERLGFAAEGWSDIVWGVNEIDTRNGGLARGSRDNPLGTGGYSSRFKARELSQGVVRLRGEFSRLPGVGNKLLLRHNRRENPAIFITKSVDVRLENINIYHAPAMGVLAQRSEDITIDKVDVKPKPGTGRVLSAAADAIHFSSCRGQISVQNSLFENQTDDAINVHGIYTRILKKTGPEQLVAKLMHPQSTGLEIAIPGDTLVFIDNRTLSSYNKNIVEHIEPLSETEYRITFRRPLPDEISENDALENMSWYPDVTIRGNTAQNNRARGFLISTRGKVLVEKNILTHMGAAILIAGDANHWFESGGVEDILIRGNHFINNAKSMYGRAVIDIHPELPIFKEGFYYHENIRIWDNYFEVLDSKILSAQSVRGLTFSNNTVEPADEYQIQTIERPLFQITHSTDIDTTENKVIDKNIILEK